MKIMIPSIIIDKFFYYTWILPVELYLGQILLVDLQLTIHVPIKLISTLESDLIIKITKVRFQQEPQTG